MKASRPFRLIAVVFVLAVTLVPVVSRALPSYGLSVYRLAHGTVICDPVGDSNPGYSDIACNSTELASIYVGSDGSTITSAFVLREDPRTTSQQAPLSSNAYVVQVGSGGTHVATIDLDAKGTGDVDEIYVKCEGNAALNYSKKASTALADGDAAVTAEPTGLFRLSFVAPVAALASCGVTASTPVQLFFGTPQAGNLDVINKDFMIGTTTCATAAVDVVVRAAAPPPADPPPADPPAAPVPPSSAISDLATTGSTPLGFLALAFALVSAGLWLLAARSRSFRAPASPPPGVHRNRRAF